MMAKKKDADEVSDGDEKKGGLGGKLKLIAMILPTLLLIGGAVYVFVLKPSSAPATPAASSTAAATADPTPTSTFAPGPIVLSTSNITINLANGHFLSLGLALQTTADASADLTAAQGLDAAITEYSGKTVDQLATPQGREAARQELIKLLMKAYLDKVYDVYFTTFVMN